MTRDEAFLWIWWQAAQERFRAEAAAEANAQLSPQPGDPVPAAIPPAEPADGAQPRDSAAETAPEGIPAGGVYAWAPSHRAELPPDPASTPERGAPSVPPPEATPEAAPAEDIPPWQAAHQTATAARGKGGDGRTAFCPGCGAVHPFPMCPVRSGG